MCSSGKRGLNILLYFKITMFLRTKSVGNYEKLKIRIMINYGLRIDAFTVMNVGLSPSTPFIGLDSDKSCLSEGVCLVEEAEAKW